MGNTFPLFAGCVDAVEREFRDGGAPALRRSAAGWGVDDGCVPSFGISRKTGYKIFNRYKERGSEAFTDRTREEMRVGVHGEGDGAVTKALLHALRREPDLSDANHLQTATGFLAAKTGSNAGEAAPVNLVFKSLHIQRLKCMVRSSTSDSGLDMLSHTPDRQKPPPHARFPRRDMPATCSKNANGIRSL